MIKAIDSLNKPGFECGVNELIKDGYKIHSVYMSDERWKAILIKETEEKPDTMPDSRDCAVQKTGVDAFKHEVKECPPCAGKDCARMFGTDLCRYHYRPKEEDADDK